MIWANEPDNFAGVYEHTVAVESFYISVLISGISWGRISLGDLSIMAWALSRNNTLRLRQNGRHFADDIFKRIFLNENIWIPIKISLKFVPKGSINNIPALVQIMAWRRPGDKPLSEPMMLNLPTHICVTRPQWDKDRLSQVWGFPC